MTEQNYMPMSLLSPIGISNCLMLITIFYYHFCFSCSLLMLLLLLLLFVLLWHPPAEYNSYLKCSYLTMTMMMKLIVVMPNTHHRRRRDATVELCHVSVGGVNTFATSSRRLTTGAFTPPTRRKSTRCRQICSDSSKLSPTILRIRTRRRRDSTRQLRCVGGVYWA